MESKISISFKNESKNFELDIIQPDLAELVHFLVENNISVTKENSIIFTENVNFDSDEFLDILIAVNDEFKDEIEKFFKNIQTEIVTYYSDEELSNTIIEKIKCL